VAISYPSKTRDCHGLSGLAMTTHRIILDRALLVLQDAVETVAEQQTQLGRLRRKCEFSKRHSLTMAESQA